MTATSETPLTLRLANPDEDGALRRLAQRDSAEPTPGPHLVAERRGTIEAAISLSTGALVADPFRPTATACELLRVMARRAREEAPRRALAPRHRPLLRERVA